MLDTVRKILICFGLFCITSIASPWIQAGLTKITSGITFYGDGFVSALALGFMSSLGRNVGASFAGALVGPLVDERRAVSWSLLVAAFYIALSNIRYHWVVPPTFFDRVSQAANYLFPALACVVAALLMTHIRNKPRRVHE